MIRLRFAWSWKRSFDSVRTSHWSAAPAQHNLAIRETSFPGDTSSIPPCQVALHNIWNSSARWTNHSYVDRFVELLEDRLSPLSCSSLSDALDFRSPSGEFIANASKDEADMALTCAITTCAFIASSSSSRMRCCLHAARFSASRARFSEAVRMRWSVGGELGRPSSLFLLAFLCCILSLTRFSASSASSLRNWSGEAVREQRHRKLGLRTPAKGEVWNSHSDFVHL